MDGDARPLGSGFDMGMDEFVFVPNNCPSLDSSGMAPTPGDTRTIYRFTAHYSDADGDSPATTNIVIDGVPRSMSLLSGSGADGVYYHDTRLGAGIHDYHFSFYDGTGCLALLPLAGDLVTGEVAGVTRYVPEDYATIQAALDDSLGGDTIIVRDGVYTGPGNKNLDFKGKAITLRSDNGPENCIIDCEGDGRGFYFHSHEPAGAMLEGFTITGGSVTGGWDQNSGGAIYCSNGARPTITNCVMDANTASWGGAIAVTDDALPEISDCEITNNSSAYGGGGFYCNTGFDHPQALTDCLISGNSTGGDGGGIFAVTSSTVTITRCDVSDNSAAGDGGAVHTSQLAAQITDSVFNRNSAGEYGGALYLRGDMGPAFIINSIVKDNTAGRDGGGIHSSGSSPAITNCLITGNSASRNGGGISVSSLPANPIIRNCTITENSAVEQGGGINCGSEGDATVVDSILAHNLAAEGREGFSARRSNLDITYSDIYSGDDPAPPVFPENFHPSEGNIDAAPLFIAGPLGEYYLRQRASGQMITSPCVNAGSDSASNLGMNAYTTRTDEMGDGGQVDMGYHYPGIPVSDLTELHCATPANESIMGSAPTFTWTTDGGANNAFVVDMALSVDGPYYTSPVIRGETHWTMPQAWWDAIPSGSYVFWYARGADLDAVPLSIIYSDEFWFFYKP